MDNPLNLNYPILLQDAEANATLASRGYVVFPLLPDPIVNQLLDFFRAHEKNDPQHFYSSSHSTDIEFRKRCSAFMKELVSPYLSTIFTNYQVLGGAFVVKPAHGKGILQPHQDWNLVDETITRSFNLWIPLVDVNVENGAVFVLDRSHLEFPAYRGPGIPSTLKNVEESIWKKMHPLNMKAGEALFYDHALIHGSPPNHTDTIRVGIVMGMMPANASMRLYTAGSNGIEEYECDEDFFLSHQPTDAPKVLRHLQTIPSTQTVITTTMISAADPGTAKTESAQKKPNLFRKLLSKLGS